MSDDDALMTLAEACRFLPGAKPDTLRAEHNRGRLTVYRVGKRVYTTARDIREMTDLLPVPASPIFPPSVLGSGR